MRLLDLSFPGGVGELKRLLEAPLGVASAVGGLRFRRGTVGPIDPTLPCYKEFGRTDRVRFWYYLLVHIEHRLMQMLLGNWGL